MSVLHKYRKTIKENTLRFPIDMYTNIVGSLVITAYILSENKPHIKDIKKQWKSIKKKGLPCWLDDKDFIDKTLALFNLTAPYGYFAFVQSRLNALFLPYIEGELLPIREDGVCPNTAYNGKVYKVEEPTILGVE